MATRFHLADGAATDLIAMTLPEFFTPTLETFLPFGRPPSRPGEARVRVAEDSSTCCS